MAEDFQVRVQVDGDVGRLEWEGAADAQTLQRAISLAADDQLVAHGLRRLEVAIPATDAMARRALHLAGFRREGIRRQALAVGDAGHVDVQLYARLASDVVYGPQGFSAVMNSVLPTKRVIAHVLFRNRAGEVLLLETTYKSDWELPGGVVEPWEPPRIGAVREVLEELGLEVVLGHPALVDWMPPSLGWDDALEYIYDAGVLDEGTISGFVTEPHEIRAAHWVPRSQLARHLTPLALRRILLLLDGFHGHTEDGIPLS